MRFVNPALQRDLEVWRLDPDARDRATADNIWFEERVSAARMAAFESHARSPTAPRALRESLIDYVRDFMEVGAGVPHTFVADMEPALLSALGLDSYQSIVRLESLERAFSKWSVPAGDPPLERLRKAIAEKHTDVIDGFLNTWNDSNVRDFRPAFAAWKDQVLPELAAEDWPDRLRDRLGLEHYNCVNGPIPVAIMEYKVQDVIRTGVTAGLTGVVTAPMVLDSRPGPYFFPAPRDLPYGRVMSLNRIDRDEDLLAEMLHVRITYRRDHIAQLGYIRRPPATHDLKELRSHHLLALQIASGREDFGEDIP